VREPFNFFFLGWARPRTGIWGLRQIDARHYATLTQHIAVRGYATLTRETWSAARRGARGAGRGLVWLTD